MKIILALGNPNDAGGPTKYAKALSNVFVEDGHVARLVSYSSWMWKLPTGLRHLCFALKLLFAVRGADVVLAFDTWSVGVPAWMVSAVTRIPLAIRIGGDFIWEQYVERTGHLIKLSEFYGQKHLPAKERFEIWLSRNVARHANALLFNSAWQRDLWLHPYGLNSARLHVLENLYPSRQPGEVSEKKVFVSAGRPLKLKQEAMLRRIIDEIAKEHAEVSLDTRALPPREHQSRVAESYAVVLASVSDAAPNGIIDAVAYGKPFICTTDTGIRERLEGTGIFVDTQNDSELRAAILSLLDPDTYARIQKRVQYFTFVRTWDDVAGDVLRILETL